MKIYKMALAFVMALFYHVGICQVTVDDNVPAATNYVGFDATSMDPLPIENRGFDEIDISSNLRSKIAITELPTWNGLNGLSLNNVQRTTMGLQGEDGEAWSMLHLRSDNPFPLTNLMRRDWMNVGVSFTTNLDFLYVGLLERPETGGPNQQTDAVMAWGCQDQPGNVDNFRFLFLQPTLPVDDGSGVQGLETMRITPEGNVGIGSDFTNDEPPHRRLTVHEGGNTPQFRIARNLAPNENFGRHADFQVDNNGILFIRPTEGTQTRPVAIGFLNDELVDPTLETRLDVSGLTRIRQLPDSLKDCLIIGTNASDNTADNYLSRLDFNGNPNQFLSGNGTWHNANGSVDNDWATDGTDVWTGHGFGFPDGRVFMGTTNSGFP